MRLRPETREQIVERAKLKRQRRKDRYEEGLFGYQIIERALAALAVRGPMPRSKLASITMLTHDDTTLNPLIEAGVVAIEQRRGSRDSVWVSLNAAFPLYRELRATLLAFAGERNTQVRDLAQPRNEYDAAELFGTRPLLWALLMMNAVPEGKIDVASLNRLRAQHAVFTLHGRMRWLKEQGIATERRQGLVLYYGLNPDHRAYKPLKRLLDRIGKVWPDMVAAAQFNDELKPERRTTQDRNARKRTAKIRSSAR